ncbi:MAG TPA: hypothetical protein VK196_12085 [Magnetospirillum sp.]|nr:hypothetical protein [Magnetospirillum sp.]
MSETSALAEAFVAEIATAGATALVGNAPVRAATVQVAGLTLPITVTAPGGTLSWVASLRSAYGPYASQELHTLPSLTARRLLAPLVAGIDAALVSAGLDRLVCVNNWLLSTNLYPRWDGSGLDQLTRALEGEHPGHFIALRSLNARHHGALLAHLQARGWSLLPSRRVWIAEPSDPPSHNRRIDARLLARTPLARAPAADFDAADWDRTADLYAQLYLDKYSSLNPAFTARFLRWSHQNGFMRIEGLRSADGQLLAVAGTIASGGVMTTPLVGYAMDAPRALGLYRLSMAIAFEDMDRRGASYNLSAGVGGFKRLRGARPAIEYTALWHRHLPLPRRLPVAGLGWLLRRLGVPVMERYDL